MRLSALYSLLALDKHLLSQVTTNIPSMDYPSRSSSSQQKDLGVIIILSSDLSWSHHISKIVSNATKYYACFANHSVPRTIQSPRKDCIYISLVRLQILYGSQIWRPMQLKDIKPVQRRATMLYSMIILPTIDQD